jgi:hypothetical protein
MWTPQGAHDDQIADVVVIDPGSGARPAISW